MFMFLHVAVGILFMVDLTWLYSITIWETLSVSNCIAYFLWLDSPIFAGAMGKKKGKPGMRELYDFILKQFNHKSLLIVAEYFVAAGFRFFSNLYSPSVPNEFAFEEFFQILSGFGPTL